MIKKFFCLFVIFLALSGIQSPQQEPLKVGVLLIPPFAMMENNKPKGIAIDLWREMAQRNNLPYKFVMFSESSNEIIDQLSSKKIDVGIGPISITPERIKKADFTISYFNSAVNLAIKKEGSYFFYIMFKFIYAFISVVSVIILGFFSYVTLYWFFERDKQEGFPKGYWETVSYFIWSHIVFHKVDFFPQTWGGKIGALIWSFLSMFLMASVIASLTSYFYVVLESAELPLKNPADLHNKVLTAVQGQHNYEVAQRWSSNVIPARTFEEALQLVKDGKAFGVVAEHYPLKYTLAHHHEFSSLQIVNVVLDRSPLAFSIRYGDPLRIKLNNTITNIDEENLGPTICTPYLGSEAQECLF
jgi:polar amino acid transport system substrate-binding protein